MRFVAWNGFRWWLIEGTALGSTGSWGWVRGGNGPRGRGYALLLFRTTYRFLIKYWSVVLLIIACEILFRVALRSFKRQLVLAVSSYIRGLLALVHTMSIPVPSEHEVIKVT